MAKPTVKKPRPRYTLGQANTFTIEGENFTDSVDVALRDKNGKVTWDPATLKQQATGGGGTTVEVTSTPKGHGTHGDGDLSITVTNQGGDTSQEVSTTVDYVS
jgi:hypothetical protein